MPYIDLKISVLPFNFQKEKKSAVPLINGLGKLCPALFIGAPVAVMPCRRKYYLQDLDVGEVAPNCQPGPGPQLAWG